MKNTIVLKNRNLSVELYGDKPAVMKYTHFKSKQDFGGATEQGNLSVNNTVIPWSQWEIACRKKGSAVIYKMSLGKS